MSNIEVCIITLVLGVMDRIFMELLFYCIINKELRFP
jgi:hypothetical protein